MSILWCKVGGGSSGANFAKLNPKILNDFLTSFLSISFSRVFYLKGCAESINVKDIDTFTLKDSLPFFIGDSDSIEKLLQAYSQHEIFFNKVVFITF
jgi:hypothetical protein